jgi:hypothetical protein
MSDDARLYASFSEQHDEWLERIRPSDGSRNLTLDTRGRFEQRVLGPSEENT